MTDPLTDPGQDLGTAALPGRRLTLPAREIRRD